MISTPTLPFKASLSVVCILHCSRSTQGSSIYVIGFGKTLYLRTKIKYKRDWIIQSVISPKGLKPQACNLSHKYSYSRSIRLLSSTQQALLQIYRGGGWGWWGVVESHKMVVTAELSNFQGKMAHKVALLHSNCHKYI